MKSLKVFLLIVLIFAPFILFAAPQGGIGTVDSTNIGRQGDIAESGDVEGAISGIFISLVDWFAWFVALASVVMALYSAILFITSAGDDAKLKKARDTLMYTVVGVVVAILAFGIVAISKSIIGQS